MQENDPGKSKSVLLKGFLAGLLTTVIIYMVIFEASGLEFTFRAFFQLHSGSILIYLADLIPIGVMIIVTGAERLKEKSISNLQHSIDENRIRIEKSIHLSGELASGNYSAVPETGGDELLDSLYTLQERLKENRNSEAIRKNEDLKRNWISEGLANFSEILRNHSGDMEKMSFMIISSLVKYLNANQGGFFLTEEENGQATLSMKACYAYDRKKFADRRIAWGEGLIGTCALEKKSSYYNSIPETYLYITSGLGKSNPKVLLLVPMVAKDEVNGILEIASFNPFEPYQIEFVERIAESIAITLDNLRNNIRTAQLLKETQAQAEELSMQEERMRQSMEELKATQEQAARQAEKFISFTNSVNHTMIRAEYDKEGYLLYANTKFLKKLGYSGNREVEGKHISLFIHDKDRDWFQQIWDVLAKGGQHFEGYMKHVTRQGQDLWTMATYTCVRKEDGDVERILFLAIDTTEQKKQSLDYESQISAINRLNIKAEFAPDGKMLDTNDLFNHTMKFPVKELSNMSVFDLLDRKDLENFNDVWERVISGSPFQGQIRMLTRFKDEKWFRATFTSVNDMYNEVAKVIYLASEITNEKMMEAEARKQTEQMKLQEEKLKLTGVELKKKLEDKSAETVRLLAEKEERIVFFEELHKHSAVPCISTDSSGIILYINEGAASLFNRIADKAIGFHASGLKPEVPSLIELFKSPASKINLPEYIQISKPGSGFAKYRLSVKEAQAGDKKVIHIFLLPQQLS